MASITLTLTSQCAAGGHFVFTLTGDLTGTKALDVEEVKRFPDIVDREAIVAAIIRIAQIGRTTAQVKTLLLAGVTVTI